MSDIRPVIYNGCYQREGPTYHAAMNQPTPVPEIPTKYYFHTLEQLVLWPLLAAASQLGWTENIPTVNRDLEDFLFLDGEFDERNYTRRIVIYGISKD